ncbi:diaminopimelate epimerase [Thermomonas haemolytica]|uniref:Diaminopimelate epimerase n=1 Tax=Thermomonas haemolytica TaxID=141949 RepID=A0A4R3NDD7_9GAMM|nr:diaminopimelate epimerase [Thermomonas haemolytica]TCT25194.1 diaminopimelate epimerase [Thermomonas haemolytica]TNY30305.1 diaminopimelate epimerase [Thermomonas haemolytica]
MRFSKMHGAGNDFVVLDLRDGRAPPTPADCARIADRHFGIGCDQLLTIEPARSAQAVASYRIWNADGSVAGQCGNGARCVAAWLVRAGAAPAQGAFSIDSPTGAHAVQRNADGDFVIDMGAPRFAPAEIPLLGFVQAQDAYPLELDGRVLAIGAVSMGNPHALLEVDAVETADVAGLGAALQRHPAFPQSANVGFAQVLAPDRIRLRVYERGAGETLACGSGACAAVAVLDRRGQVHAADGVTVELPGGVLRIQRRADGHLWMAGPAAFVFEGEWS